MSFIKSFFLSISWIAGYLNIHYMPIDLIVISAGSIFLTAKALCYGVCAGYTVWLLWHDQVTIYAVAEAVYFMAFHRAKNWWLNKV